MVVTETIGAQGPLVPAAVSRALTRAPLSDQEHTITTLKVLKYRPEFVLKGMSKRMDMLSLNRPRAHQ